MYTYIIIDDEELIRKGTQKKLQSMADLVTCIGEAEDGIHGIRLIEEKNPDFVILDMQMPCMDGTELLPYLAEHFPGKPLIVISGFRDFDYVKHAISADAIDYLLKPVSKQALQDCVHRAMERLENSQSISRQITDSYEQKEHARYEYDIQNLTNLVLGYHTGEAVVSSEKLKFINNTHRLMLLTLYFDPSASSLSVQDWLDDGGFGDLALYLPGSTTTLHTGFLILFMPNASVVSPHSLIHQITEALLTHAQQQSLPLLIGISQVHSDLKELHEAFLETSEALNQQELDYSSYGSYSYFKEAEPKPVFWEHEDEFLFRIEAGMTDEVQNLTENLFAWFLTIPRFTLLDAKYYCYQLSNECRGILNDYLKQGTENSSRSIQNIVSQIFRLEDLKKYYMQYFLNITEMLKKDSVYALDDVIEKIQVYMQRNYQKNLTQDFIASLFYLNRSYLSTLFKQKAGMKFIDYLNDIRIEKSKELLSGSNRKMYQISKAVGYDNPKYFFRIFKKKTGLTPEQYRLRFSNSD